MPPTLENTIAQLEATLEATHDGILVLDAEHRVVHFNRHFVEMFRFPRDLVSRRDVNALLQFVANQLVLADGERLLSDRLWDDDSAEYLSRIRFKDGRVYERFVAPQRVGDAVIGRVISYRDISESVRQAQALEQHQAFLERAQQVAHIGSWVAEFDGSDQLGWSAETYRIFGVSSNAFPGTSTAFFQFVHEDDRAAVREAMAAAARDAAKSFDIEHRIVRAGGVTRWVQEKADVVRDERGHAVRMIGTVQDITERRLLEEQLRQLQKMEAIGRLAGGIAHDLNNALTAIAGYAELALGSLAAEHRARPDIEEVRRGAERAASVTRQLLAFSRKQLLEPRRFDVNDTAANMARMLSRILGPDVRVTARLVDAPAPIVGDPGQIEQAIVNLAVNAKDAMPNGGELILATSLEDVDESAAMSRLPIAAGRYVVLRVVDTGCGMAPETQARAFEPFFTTKGVGKGTGLGLSMVYGTVKQSGGFVFVNSEVGRGTTIELYFPPAPEAAAATAVSREHAAATILAVEDEPAVRNLVASTLRHEALTVLLATSAEEALHVATTHEGDIDLLLTDAVMPGKSGIELARALMERRPDLRVIIMSGYAGDSLSLNDLPRPVELLQKPFSPRELRRRVREALDR